MSYTAIALQKAYMFMEQALQFLFTIYSYKKSHYGNSGQLYFW